MYAPCCDEPTKCQNATFADITIHYIAINICDQNKFISLICARVSSVGGLLESDLVPREPDGNIAIAFAVVTYSVSINPREVKPLAHKLSLDQESPFQHVKPSMLKLAKDALSSKTPKRALQTVMSNKGGIASDCTPTDFPRNTRQLRDLKHDSKIPGKSVTGAGRPAKGNMEELLKMMQSPDSFVRDCSTIAPEKEGDQLCFRVFLADR